MDRFDRVIILSMLLSIIISLFFLRNEMVALKQEVSNIANKEVILECK